MNFVVVKLDRRGGFYSRHDARLRPGEAVRAVPKEKKKSLLKHNLQTQPPLRLLFRVSFLSVPEEMEKVYITE